MSCKLLGYQEVEGMSVTLNDIIQHYWACHNCMVKAGGEYPKGHVCTVCYGVCKLCGDKSTLIPWVDYNWPSEYYDTIAKQRRD